MASLNAPVRSERLARLRYFTTTTRAHTKFYPFFPYIGCSISQLFFHVLRLQAPAFPYSGLPMYVKEDYIQIVGLHLPE